MYLEKINGPEDIKKLKKEQLQTLADETRNALINKISNVGGHSGPNLGVVELTIAMHYVFDSPKDKIVFDVSHQSYPHKILTGRKQAFMDSNHFGDVTGYTNPLESEHDLFTIGHTSTSVSLALGLAKGRDLKKTNENVIAIIGDGSLSGGEALEALDYAGEYKNNLIIIVNDNDQSIAENHGGIYKTLKDLRENNGESNHNMFKAFGLEYKYLDDGHNIEKLIELFESVKGINHPVVLHIHTIKGKGLSYAEANRELWHAGGPFNIEDGSSKGGGFNLDPTVFESLKELLDNNDKAVVLNAGTPMGLGFIKGVREKYVNRGQFIDVGIAEEHAIAMISGIAKNGGKPIFATHSSFIQRTFDQMSQDLCINNNPATILVNTASVYGMNDVTHLGIFDIPLISNIPNMVYLAPTSKDEYFAMLDWSIEQQEHPVAIRIPCNGVITDKREVDTDYSDLNKYKVEEKGSKIAIIALGDFYQLGEEIAKEIKAKLNITPTLINPRYITGQDINLLEELKNKHEIVITLEDGILDGGFGEKISRFYGTSNMKVKNYGIKKSFPDRYDANELLKENGISKEQILEDIINLEV